MRKNSIYKHKPGDKSPGRDSKTITGVKGIGGIETRGKYRDGFPREPYNIK